MIPSRRLKGSHHALLRMRVVRSASIRSTFFEMSRLTTSDWLTARKPPFVLVDVPIEGLRLVDVAEAVAMDEGLVRGVE